MKLLVLALDYDGTIATDGALHPEVRSAILLARARGVAVLLVSGRILSDLRRVCDVSLFEAIVAENGAVLAFPRVGRSSLLAPRVSTAFVEALARRNAGARVGECVVELDASAAQMALEELRRLELPLVLHFNRSRLMVLPQAVSKATGLREALRTLRLSVHNCAAIGDAENDHALLSACELGAAVSWGSPALRAIADQVVEGQGPEAVGHWIRGLLEQSQIPPPVSGRRRQVVLGTQQDGSVALLTVGGKNVLITGDPRSGKSWVAGLLSEQMILQGYCLCLIDPEGDYRALEILPGVIVLGGNQPPPSMNELTRILRHADVSVVLDLVRLNHAEKREYTAVALRTLADLRRATGLPHRIVVDEAHKFLVDSDAAELLDAELAGYTLITYRAAGLHPSLLETTEYIVITRETDAHEARLLHELWRGTPAPQDWTDQLKQLEINEALVLPAGQQGSGEAMRVRIAPRLTHHVRHRHKYLAVPVEAQYAFHFRFENAARGPTVTSLQDLADVLARTPLERIAGHIGAHDFSRWIADVIHDEGLAASVRDFEERHALGMLPDFNGALIHALRERYRVGSDSA